MWLYIRKSKRTWIRDVRDTAPLRQRLRCLRQHCCWISGIGEYARVGNTFTRAAIITGVTVRQELIYRTLCEDPPPPGALLSVAWESYTPLCEDHPPRALLLVAWESYKPPSQPGYTKTDTINKWKLLLSVWKQRVKQHIVLNSL